MRKKKKNGNQEEVVKIIVLVTAILNLIKVVVEIINRLLE